MIECYFVEVRNRLIPNEKISFCIQGQISIDENGFNQSDQLIRSIKQFFPGSPIIFATWFGVEVSLCKNLEGIDLVLLEDPGSGPRFYGHPHLNNINRQIISSREALKRAKTEYVVKIRSDSVLTSARLRRVLSKLPKTPESEISIFKKYVAVLDRYTIHPNGPLGIPMHPCDHIQAGLLEDVSKYWIAPEMSQEDEEFFSQDILNHNQRSEGHIPRHRAETYFWKEAVKAHTGQDLESMLTKESELEISTLSTFTHNLIPLNKKSLGIQSQKYNWGLELVTYTYTFILFDWFMATKGYKLKPRMVPFSYVELLGTAYRGISRSKNFIFNRNKV